MEANGDWRMLSWILALLVILLSLVFFYLMGGGPWLRHFSAPILLFLTAVPWPTGLENRIVYGLTFLNATSSVEFCHLLGIPALLQGNAIATTNGIISIDEACSGIRSLQASLMLSLCIGEWFRLRFSQRLFLLVAGISLAILGNFIRTLFLVGVGVRKSVAEVDRWHNSTGLLVLLMTMAILWTLSFWLDFKRKEESTEATPSKTAPNFFSPLPVLFLIIWAILGELGTELWYRNHESRIIAGPNWSVAWPTNASNLKQVDLAQRVLTILKYNEAKGASWTDPDGSSWFMMRIKWNPGRTAVHLARNHQPELCLPVSAGLRTAFLGTTRFLIGNVDFEFRVFEFQDQGQEKMFLFHGLWENSQTPLVHGFEDLGWRERLRNVRLGKRMLGQQIVQIGIKGPGSFEEAEKRIAAKFPTLVTIEN
jgi:exosortase